MSLTKLEVVAAVVVPKKIAIPGMPGKSISPPRGGYAGPASKYKFSTVQQKNYLAIAALLAEKGMKLGLLSENVFIGDANYIVRYTNKDAKAKLVSFVAVVGNPEAPEFVWYKYEGAVAGGGQNNVYWEGIKCKVSDFVRVGWKYFGNPEKDRLAKDKLKKAASERLRGMPTKIADATWPAKQSTKRKWTDGTRSGAMDIDFSFFARAGKSANDRVIYFVVGTETGCEYNWYDQEHLAVRKTLVWNDKAKKSKTKHLDWYEVR